MPEKTISVESITCAYGSGANRFVALDRISAEFHRGEVTLLMGASGSGKTTLLSILGCLRSPDSGCVELLGMNLGGLGESGLVGLRRKHIGFVFQAFRLFPALNALENVMIPNYADPSLRRSRASAMELLDAVGLGGKAHLRPGQMSGGEQQRVGIARALLKDPQILLADEPTASLDAGAGLAVADLLRVAATKRGCTVVVATHDPRLIPIADRVLQMRDGCIPGKQDNSA